METQRASEGKQGTRDTHLPLLPTRCSCHPPFLSLFFFFFFFLFFCSFCAPKQNTPFNVAITPTFLKWKVDKAAKKSFQTQRRKQSNRHAQRVGMEGWLGGLGLFLPQPPPQKKKQGSFSTPSAKLWGSILSTEVKRTKEKHKRQKQRKANKTNQIKKIKKKPC